MPAVNPPSPAATEERVLRVPLDQLHAHPSNPNQMSDERRETLARNIKREGRYPPLIARPHPTLPGEWQVLDGHQRVEVLRRIGHAEAVIYPWDCDDETALILLATLNRLEGEDIPWKRAGLLAELDGLRPLEELAALLPEDASELKEALAVVDLDADALLAELDTAVSDGSTSHVVTFTIRREDEDVIERALEHAAAAGEGGRQRGRALVLVCRKFMETFDA